jgi:dethiobiotin synthetase
LRGIFVTGTDTGVGKTVLAAAIVAALRRRGLPVRACKPVLTGLDAPTDPDWPPDHELLALAGGGEADEIMLVGFGPPVSPHLAAELAGRPLDPDRLAAAIRDGGADGGLLIVEGVGGLLVPLADGYDVRALVGALALPLLIAARPGLGTLNHTLLTLEAARHAGIEPLAVVLTPWPDSPDEIERSNLQTIERLGRVPVATLAPVARPAPDLLAAAGAALPLDRWLAASR